jgi:chromobox protein 1
MEEFEVEEIVAKRVTKGVVQYCVKWIGYDEQANSWLSLEDLNCIDLVSEFENRVLTSCE